MRFFEYLNLAAASLLVFAPIFALWFNLPIKSDDYLIHLSWAEKIVKAPQLLPASVIAHAAWQWLAWFGYTVFNLSWGTSGLVVTLASVVATVTILYWLLRKQLSPLLSGALAIGLMIVAPLFFLKPQPNFAFLVNGYIATNVFHNPTFLLLKPFAVLQFVYAADVLRQPRSAWKTILLTAIISSFAIFSKPSYVICLLPALALVIAVQMFKKHSLDWARLLLGVVLPSLAFLLWQYLITFGPEADSSIVFSPLTVMSHYSTHLLLKLILSLIFPLVVTALCWKQAIKDYRIQLGWLGFIVSAVLVYFFSETGVREFDVNFLWSAEIALFILFVACVLFLAESRHLLDQPFRKWLILSSGMLHLIFGFYYFFYTIYNLLTYTLFKFWW